MLRLRICTWLCKQFYRLAWELQFFGDMLQHYGRSGLTNCPNCGYLVQRSNLFSDGTCTNCGDDY